VAYQNDLLVFFPVPVDNDSEKFNERMCRVCIPILRHQGRQATSWEVCGEAWREVNERSQQRVELRRGASEAMYEDEKRQWGQFGGLGMWIVEHPDCWIGVSGGRDLKGLMRRVLAKESWIGGQGI
jgi:hypothetical protein